MNYWSEMSLSQLLYILSNNTNYMCCTNTYWLFCFSLAKCGDDATENGLGLVGVKFLNKL